MARSASRTVTISIDMGNKINDLFGTIMNAYGVLGLEGIMTYPQFYRGLQFETITPSQKEEIESAWERWCFLFIRPEVPLSTDFILTPEIRDHAPSWHPDSLVEVD